MQPTNKCWAEIYLKANRQMVKQCNRAVSKLQSIQHHAEQGRHNEREINGWRRGSGEPMAQFSVPCCTRHMGPGFSGTYIQARPLRWACQRGCKQSNSVYMYLQSSKFKGQLYRACRMNAVPPAERRFSRPALPVKGWLHLMLLPTMKQACNKGVHLCGMQHCRLPVLEGATLLLPN